MEYSIACSEVWYILQSLKQEELCKIPKKLIELIYTLKEDDYVSEIDLSKPLEEQELSKATIGLISFIYNNYLGTEEEKEEYEKTYKEYSKNIEDKNYELKFNKQVKETAEIKKETIELTNYTSKRNIFYRIINKIKEFLKINKTK